MSIKDILVHLDVSEKGAYAPEFATSLASELGAHLTAAGVVVEITPPASFMGEFPYDLMVEAADQAREAALGGNKIGTTGRGIGPAYEDKVGRRAIRVAHIADEIAQARVVVSANLHFVLFQLVAAEDDDLLRAEVAQQDVQALGLRHEERRAQDLAQRARLAEGRLEIPAGSVRCG